MLRDVIQGWRALRHAPGFAVATILTLAIGLGATVTMFAAVSAAFLEPLPYPAEQALVKVYQTGPNRGGIRVPLPILSDWAAEARTFDALAGYLSGATVNVSDGDTAHRANLARVTRAFFDTMRVSPIRGRAFGPLEAVEGGPPAAVIGYRLWHDVFGGRETVLDETLLLDGAPVAIIGVMPEGFRFPDASDVWASIEREGGFESRTAHNFDVVGRLGAGETPTSATADLESVTGNIGRIHPDVAAEGLGVTVTPLRDDLLGSQSSLVLIGLGAVLCVLIVACVNAANLMLARSLTRDTDTGIRLAMGAGRTAIVRSIVAEGLVLAAAGAALGCVFSLWGTRLVTRLTPESVTGGVPLSIDVRVLFLTLVATAATGVVCALLPAWRSAGIDARQALASGNRSVARAPRRAMHVLVGVEVALAFVLLVGAGLLTASHARLEEVNPGFRTSDLTLAHMSLGFLPGSTYATPDARRRYWQEIETAVSDAPGVRAVALAALLPGGFSPNGALRIDDRADVEQAHFRLVGGDYFGVLEIPLTRGRGFTAADSSAAPQVAVVNETLVRTLFGGADPIGRVISMNGIDGGSGSATIVGVAADVRHLGPATAPVPEVYFSYVQRPWRTFSMRLVIDSTLPPADLASLVRERAGAVDPLVPPAFSTMAERMAAYVEPAEYRARLIGTLAIVAFLMSAIGIAGVVSYGITRRQYEFGIRVALGATPAAVMRLVVAAGMAPVAVGLAAGLLGAMSLSRLLSTFLFWRRTRRPTHPADGAGRHHGLGPGGDEPAGHPGGTDQSRRGAPATVIAHLLVPAVARDRSGGYRASMRIHASVAAVAAALFVLPGAAMPAGGQATSQAQTTEPQTRQPRLPDVIWVPTRDEVVDAMLKMASVTKDDVVYDLGSGDGKIVIAAARLGARGVGIDIDPQRIQEANANAEAAGVTDRVRFIQGDIFDTNIPIGEATVVTLYLLPQLNIKLMPRLKSELKPGSRIVSNSFDMGPDWPSERMELVGSFPVYFWTIPER